jgi:hypothetical protein
MRKMFVMVLLVAIAGTALAQSTGADLVTGSTWTKKTYQEKRSLYSGFMYGFLFANQLTELADERTGNTTASDFLRSVLNTSIDSNAVIMIALVDEYYSDPVHNNTMFNEAMSDAFIKEARTRKDSQEKSNAIGASQ